MKATRTFAITLIGIAALGLAAWFGWAAFGPNTAEGGGREFTYGNVSLTLPPEQSGLHAIADYAPPESGDKPGGGPVVVVTDDSEAHSGYIVIDANTGEVLVDTIRGALRDAADDVRASIREPEGADAIWPLADVAPPVGRNVTWGVLTYTKPESSSGIFVGTGTWDGIGKSGQDLFIYNGRSRMIAFVTVGETSVSALEFDMTGVLAQDRGAFERLATTIKVDRTPGKLNNTQ